MKCDRIGLKITFLILISGLVLISNVAISQTPRVDIWTPSTDHLQPTDPGEDPYKEIELKDVTFQVKLTGRNLNLVKLKFELTIGGGPTGTKAVDPELNADNTVAVYKVHTATVYEGAQYEYVPYNGMCHPKHEDLGNGLCRGKGSLVAGPGKHTLRATLVPTATNDETVTVANGVSTSDSWKFWIVDTDPNPPGPQQPPPINPPGRQQPPQQQPVQQNNAPAFTDGSTTTRSVAENTASGVNIGSAVSADDPDNDTLTYTLGGTDAASFSIVSTTGQLRTSAALDHETKGSYTVTVSVSDGNGSTDSITVTINVTDVTENSAPVFTDGTSTTRTVAENTDSGTNIGSSVSATDAEDDPLTYTLGGTDAASFRIVSKTGQLQTSTALDYETKTSYSLTVTVSDDSTSTSITVTINITDVDETVAQQPPPSSGAGPQQPPPPVSQNNAPVFTDGASTTRSISENTGSGASIGTAVSATDQDNDSLTYTLSGTDAAAFSIVSTTGQLQTSAALDYETKTSYSLTVTVSDGSTSTSITVTINITDVDETEDQQQEVEQGTTPPVQPPTNNQTSGGGTLSQPATSDTVKPFDYEAEGVGKVVFSEWMLSTLNNMPQWIELYNTTNEDINLRGWQIVGRFMDGNDNIHILKSHTIKSLTVKAKQSYLIVAYLARVYRGSFSENLQDNVYSLRSIHQSWNRKGIVLELQDNRGNPIDRIGNLNEQDQVEWRIPSRTRDWGNSERRISLIRRLKSVKSRRYNFRLGVTEFGWFPADEVQQLTETKRSEYFYGMASDVGTPGYRTEGADPLPVTLSSFIPQIAESGQVVLRWTTASEIENAGFNVLRSESAAGSFTKINASLIQGAGTTSDRNEYTWIDTTAKPNIEYYYRIEDMSFDGISEVVATQRLKGLFTAKNRSLTRWAILKKATE